MFPEDYLAELLIIDTKKGLSLPMDIQEFIKWVGCWLYMECWVGIESARDWCSTTTQSMAKGAPFRINHIMSCNRFDSILSANSFTNTELTHEYGFLNMCQLEEAWNENMAQQFFPSWINVLDDSMMEWFNKWVPGFMCVGRNPHLFGNEWNTICCALTYILWRAQIVEDKERPSQLGPKKWEETGKTVGIMLRMGEPIFLTVKCVVLDNGFSVSKGSTSLLDFGVYVAALIKKRKYWPKVYRDMPLTKNPLTKMLLM